MATKKKATEEIAKNKTRKKKEPTVVELQVIIRKLEDNVGNLKYKLERRDGDLKRYSEMYDGLVKTMEAYKNIILEAIRQR